ncbi:DedA family protein [Allokutzneria multivorans]|uniref:DedA family protein n=1 Tax=Allokutzneria multivorans TaxID=1142134 RepID=A0ABP7RJQ8_9PSEU
MTATQTLLAWDPLGTGGPVLIWAVVVSFIFAECALVIGLFLPGDSLLFTAGVLLAQQGLPGNAWGLAIATTLVAIWGNDVGYRIGVRTGTRVLAREGGKVLNRENLDRARNFLDRYGFWAIVAARWLPWVRTLAPMIAGAARMDRGRFFWSSVIGSITWAPLLILFGYYAAGLLDRHPWLKVVAIVAFLVVVLTGTVYGAIRFRQDMKRPIDESASSPDRT